MLGDLRNYKMCLATRRGLWRDGEIHLAIMGASRDAGGLEEKIGDVDGAVKTETIHHVINAFRPVPR
jgi:hypothetical protein